MPKRFTAVLLATVALTASSAAHAAKVYKWVDADGTVQYTQTPPPERARATEIKTRASAISDEEAKKRLEELSTRGSDERRSRELVARENQETGEADARRKKNCEIAQSNRKVLAESGRVQANDAAGNPFYLSEEVRQQKLADTEKQVAEFCS